MTDPKTIIAASRQPASNTLATWLRDLASLIDALTIDFEDTDKPANFYATAAGHTLDLCTIARAYAKPYPDDLRRDAATTLAGIIDTATAIRDGASDELLALTGADGDTVNRRRFTELRDRYASTLNTLADRASGHDLEHGVPKPPTRDGDYTAAELAAVLASGRTPKRSQGRPAEHDPEHDRKLAESWQAMRASGVASYKLAAATLGIREDQLRAAVERHRKRSN